MTNFILLSLDIEEFDLPTEYNITINPIDALRLSYEGLNNLVPLIEDLKIITTCFCTAHFAMHHKSLIRSLASKHEIACHGYFHSPDRKEEPSRAKEALEDIISKEVIGYRASRLGQVEPSNLLKSGFAYDSSINPTWIPGRYRNLSMPILPFKVDGLWRLPISVIPIIRFPLFWLSFKNLPPNIYRILIDFTLKRTNYLNIYFHPWEFSDLSGYAIPSYLKDPYGLKMLKRLEILLLWLKGQGRFITASNYVDEVLNKKEIDQSPKRRDSS